MWFLVTFINVIKKKVKLYKSHFILFYLCSALYVVDLKKFRKIAAGDRLRGQYQALSQDPNSLSNLDQVYMALSNWGFIFFIFPNMHGIILNFNVYVI